MKYLNGQHMRLGDQVDLGGGMTGIIVCCFDEGFFSIDYPESKWSGPNTGVLVKSEQAGLIHFSKPDIDLVLIQRASPHASD